MWTAVILVCQLQSCSAVGGPVMKSRELCEMDLEASGRSFIELKFPNAEILGMRCIEWGEST